MLFLLLYYSDTSLSAFLIVSYYFSFFYSTGSLQHLAMETNYFGFPCVLSSESQLLAGFITRKDILSSLGNDPDFVHPVIDVHVFYVIIHVHCTLFY